MDENSYKLRDELAIWDRFRNGCEDDFAALFELSSDRLYRYGSKFTKNEELVKDCIQDLFIKLHKSQRKLPKLNNPIFYLFKALKNIIIDTIQQEEKIIYFTPQELPFHVHFTFDPKEDLAESELKEKFEKVISFLSDRQKEAIYLRFQSEMSYDEISQLLGINYQSARNLIHRAIEKIRSEMDLKIFIALFISVLR